MNELVRKFNNVQADVIKNYPKPEGYDYNVHYIQTSPIFEKHRFCEAGHSFEDQWASADVWVWNLQWNNGQLEADPGGKGNPEGAPDGDIPVISLDAAAPGSLDFQVLGEEGDDGEGLKIKQSGFGWTARPFHLKPRGYDAMKIHFIDTMKYDKIPGVVGSGDENICKLRIKEIWTCEDSYENLYASLTVIGSDGQLLYVPHRSTSSPDVPINNNDPLKIKESGMNMTLVIIGEHQNGYNQFYYDEAAWTAGTTKAGENRGDAKCDLDGEDWNKNGPECPGSAILSDIIPTMCPIVRHSDSN